MKIDINGTHTLANKDVEKYIRRKVSALQKFVPRAARTSLIVDVHVKEVKRETKKECSCEFVLQLPHETLTAKEATVNMFAAVDIVQEKMKHQLKKYKEKHYGSKRSSIKRILGQLRD